MGTNREISKYFPEKNYFFESILMASATKSFLEQLQNQKSALIGYSSLIMCK